MNLPRAFWLLWFGQTFSRLGTLAPAFLILYLEQGDLVTDRITPLIVGLFGAGIVMSGLVGGAVADLIGPRRTIIAAQPVTAVMAMLFVVTDNVVALCALSLATGFLSAVDRPAGAGLIAKIVPQEQFSKAYSLFLVGFNVGMSLSPVISGFLLASYPPALFFVWAACAAIYAVLVRALPADEVRAAERVRDEGAPRGAAGGGASALGRAVRGVAEPFQSRVLVAFLILCFLLACIYLQINSALPLDMRASGLTPSDIGVVLAINAVLSIALLPLVPKVVGSMREETPLVLAAGLIAIGFGVNALAGDMVSFIVATVVWTLGEVLWAPMSATFITNRAPEGRVSTYQGSYFFAWNAAFVVGGPIGLTVANAYGYATLWTATLVLGLGVALGFKLMTRIPDTGPTVAPDLAGPTTAPDTAGPTTAPDPVDAPTTAAPDPVGTAAAPPAADDHTPLAPTTETR
ncbi:MFS transporter [Streptomyces sp. H27-D2]|uniref:MFS transporter n=1 Tax=Streptomyces sp. H27-D2 TaxID=3046304 RepID=UPI002DB64E3D|nr:MFS transporter [Streptomyces sp. H27-D2]MEC4015054.1 MFS transporter [Streptomyces sp. H27-D2]